MIAFGIVIWLRDAPVHFLGGLGSSESQSAVDGTKIDLSSRTKRVAKKRTQSQHRRVANGEQGDVMGTVRGMRPKWVVVQWCRTRPAGHEEMKWRHYDRDLAR